MVMQQYILWLRHMLAYELKWCGNTCYYSQEMAPVVTPHIGGYELKSKWVKNDEHNDISGGGVTLPLP
jgi:hypothetical protein